MPANATRYDAELTRAIAGMSAAVAGRTVVLTMNP
jgi:hypothetical protein